jgi:hypothetical protein
MNESLSCYLVEANSFQDHSKIGDWVEIYSNLSGVS